MTFRHRDEGGRARAGRLRVVHAQAVHRAPRLRHAHPPVAVRGRPQRLLRGGRASTSCPRSAGRSSPGCSGTPARSRRSPTSGSTPTSGCSGGGEAPAYVCWGHNNRSALVRVPMYKPHKGQSTRVELRSLDSACNPYLAFAVMLAAGLKGIEEGYELPPRRRGRRVGADRRRSGGRWASSRCRTNLSEAIRRDGAVSELVAETLGEHVFDFFLRNKRPEWDDYRRAGHAVRAGPLPPGAVTVAIDRTGRGCSSCSTSPTPGRAGSATGSRPPGSTLDVVHPYAGDELPPLAGVRRRCSCSAARWRPADDVDCPWLPADPGPARRGASTSGVPTLGHLPGRRAAGARPAAARCAAGWPARSSACSASTSQPAAAGDPVFGAAAGGPPGSCSGTGRRSRRCPPARRCCASSPAYAAPGVPGRRARRGASRATPR